MLTIVIVWAVTSIATTAAMPIMPIPVPVSTTTSAMAVCVGARGEAQGDATDYKCGGKQAKNFFLH